MITKASERLYLAFFFKMNQSSKKWAGFSERKDYQRNLRETQRSERRQAIFIMEYVQLKYFDIFSEAAQYYNELNTLYPTRPDLRKSQEYRNWKKGMNTQIVRQRKQSTIQIYKNIDEPERTETSCEPERTEISSEPERTEISCCESEHEDSNSESEYEGNNGEPERTETSCEPERTEISSEPERTETSCEPERTEISSEPERTEISCESEHEDSNSESEYEGNNGEPERTEINNRGNCEMRLEIPLINYKTKTPTVTTETLETCVEEVLDQSTVETDLINELTEERIEQIINELREDPDLNHIFDDFEQDVMMDIDEGIDIDTRLENELLEW